RRAPRCGPRARARDERRTRRCARGARGAGHAGPPVGQARSQCAGAPGKCTEVRRAAVVSLVTPAGPFRGARRPPHAAARSDGVDRMATSDILASIYRLDISKTFSPPNAPTTNRGIVLDLAILGLLEEQPLHGYELRKRLSDALGMLLGI